MNYGAFSSSDWDTQAQNYGIPGRGQFQPQDAPRASEAPQAPAGYTQPPANTPAPPWSPAPPAPVPSNRTAQDPTKLTGIQPFTPQAAPGPWAPGNAPAANTPEFTGGTPTSQGGLGRPDVVRNTPFTPSTPLTAGAMDYTGMSRGAAQVNPMSFSGFNDARALSGGDANSAKDAFRDLVGQSGIDVRGLSKQEVGAKLESELIPFLNARGFPARAIPGSYDQIEIFSNERGWEKKDVVANAGSPDAQWWWGDVGGAEGAMGAIPAGFNQQAAGGAGPEEMALAQQLGIDTSNPLWRQMFEAWFNNQDSADPTQFGVPPPPSY
jgi:hypothetical protein